MTDRDLFIAALDHGDPAERTVWLDHACAGDAERRRRVGVLLQAHDDASRFLAAPAVAPAEIDWRSVLAPAEQPGQLGKLGHYEVLEVVGRGGMGVVLKALDPKLHRVVALKLMAPHLAANAAARQRFEREARAIAAVRNDHVVAIHGVEANVLTPYLVMEFVGGVSLQEKLEQHGPLDVKEILRIGMQAARGLAAAHAQGLVHRDVKPANILLENGVERVKITDFGLARAADDATLTQSGVITGTPNYMSPEQALGQPVDARSDLFSLGGVLYALCTGHPPFRAETSVAVLRRVCDDPARPVREINPDIPAWLDAVVSKLLAKNPAQRCQSATEVADLLGQYLAHLQQPNAVPLPRFAELPPRSPHTPTAGCLLLLLLLASAGVAFLFVADGPPYPSANSGSPVARALSTGYMLACTLVLLLVDWTGRQTARDWQRHLWDAAIALVLLSAAAGLLLRWTDLGAAPSRLRPEGWYLLGISAASLLVNVPTLFRAFSGRGRS